LQKWRKNNKNGIEETIKFSGVKANVTNHFAESCEKKNGVIYEKLHAFMFK